MRLFVERINGLLCEVPIRCLRPNPERAMFICVTDHAKLRNVHSLPLLVWFDGIMRPCTRCYSFPLLSLFAIR